jgi:hypothetical protein
MYVRPRKTRGASELIKQLSCCPQSDPSRMEAIEMILIARRAPRTGEALYSPRLPLERSTITRGSNQKLSDGATGRNKRSRATIWFCH